MIRTRNHAKPQMTYDQGTQAARLFLYQCRPSAFDKLTAEDLCRWHKVKPDVAAQMLLKARSDRAGEVR